MMELDRCKFCREVFSDGWWPNRDDAYWNDGEVLCPGFVAGLYEDHLMAPFVKHRGTRPPEWCHANGFVVIEEES